MSVRFYIDPVQQYGGNGAAASRGPSYLEWMWNPGGLDVPWSMRDYGGLGETTMIVAAEVTPEQHAWLAAQPGVFAIPEDLDASLSPAELSAFESHLESVMIPADWLTPSDTWRSALRTVLGMFAMAGKYAVLVGESILDSGITMNTQFRNFPQHTQDALQLIAISRGYPWGDVKQNWAARRLLKWFADQWPTDSFRFGSLGTI